MMILHMNDNFQESHSVVTVHKSHKKLSHMGENGFDIPMIANLAYSKQ